MKQTQIITRPNDDHYRTPPECFRALLVAEWFDGTIHECCAGDGIGAAALAETRDGVIASTITPVPNSYHPVHALDVLEMTERVGQNIVTNPPYGYLHGRRRGKAGAATAILQHLIGLYDEPQGGGKICLLMDIRYRLSETRTVPGGILHDYPPARIHAFADRVTMYPGDVDPNTKLNTGTIPFGWFVWEPPYYRPGSGTLLTTHLISRDFRRHDDRERFNLPLVSGRKMREAAE